MDDFAKRIALVTGATRGIGRAVSQAFLDRGATVIGVYGGNEEAAAQFRKTCGVGEERLRLHRVDVSDYEAVVSLYETIEEEFDGLDILVCGAGIRRDSVLALMRPEDWRRVIDVNLTGSFQMARFAVPLMMRQKFGRILFITSPMSYMGFAGQANYAASKAGQVGMMKALAKEVARKKITVNCVSPGFVATDFLDGLSETQIGEYKKMVPMRRFGTPEEVADAVLFLAGPGAAYITGSVLEITGGLT